MSQAVR